MKPNTLYIFFDGTCGLCHAFVRFALPKISRKISFFFAPQEGKTFQELIQESPKLQNTVVVYQKGEKWVKFEAVLKVLKSFVYPWKFFYYLTCWFPKGAGNRLYDFVARHRKRLFRKPKSRCPVLNEEERAHLLDE